MAKISWGAFPEGLNTKWGRQKIEIGRYQEDHGPLVGHILKRLFWSGTHNFTKESEAFDQLKIIWIDQELDGEFLSVPLLPECAPHQGSNWPPLNFDQCPSLPFLNKKHWDHQCFYHGKIHQDSNQLTPFEFWSGPSTAYFFCKTHHSSHQFWTGP